LAQYKAVIGLVVAGNSKPGCGGASQFVYRHLMTFNVIVTSIGRVFDEGFLTKYQVKTMFLRLYLIQFY